MSASGGGGRSSWNEADIELLASNERLLALVAYQRARFPDNIRYSREAIELWLGRRITDEDWGGSNFLPSGAGLSYEAFNEALREIFGRVDRGEMLLPPDLLDRYPDIRDYTPRLPEQPK